MFDDRVQTISNRFNAGHEAETIIERRLRNRYYKVISVVVPENGVLCVGV